jgi:hypothetical protein
MLNQSAPDSTNELLHRSLNPFRGSIVGDPWKTTNDGADVPRIHQRVYETCCHAVDAARSNNGSAGIIINGEPGSGKTHLIGRLRKRLTDDLVHPTLEKRRQAFAYVRLDTSASSLARHVRRRVVDDLLRKVRGPNQFERLVLTRLMEFDNGDGYIGLWWEHFRDERMDDCRELLSDLCLQEGISTAFVEVLVHLVAQRHRLDVAAWLRGDTLTPAALQRLGVAADDPDDHPERVASRFLSDLMKLAGSNMPLVLCFDQIEALQTAPDDIQSIFTFGQLVSQLHDADNNLVIISCMQSSLYQDVIRVLPVPDVDRLRSFATESLNPLNEDLASQLLSHRLKASEQIEDRPDDASEIWPFTTTDVNTFVGRVGTTPRRLLDQAARRFDELMDRSERVRTETVSDPISREWERRLETAELDNSPQRSVSILRDSVSLLMKLTRPEWNVEGDPRHDDVLDFLITSPDGEGKVGIKVCDDSSIRMSAQLRRLSQQFPNSLGIQKLVLLKDERTPISRNAVATQKYLKELEINDAVYLRVAPAAIAALDALKELLADAKSGDLSFDGTNLSADTVIEWLRGHLPPALSELAETLSTPAGGDGMDTSSVVERLQELLNDRRVCRADEAAGLLNRSAPDLLAAASERADLFRVLDGGVPVIFSARTTSSALNESLP